MKIKILGKIWNLKFVKYLSGKNKVKYDGLCESPDTKDKTIYIQKGLSEQDEFETIIHECLHAASWHLDEEFITQCAADITKVLMRLNYGRKQDTGE